jgi:hypothetical protein
MNQVEKQCIISIFQARYSHGGKEKPHYYPQVVMRGVVITTPSNDTDSLKNVALAATRTSSRMPLESYLPSAFEIFSAVSDCSSSDFPNPYTAPSITALSWYSG